MIKNKIKIINYVLATTILSFSITQIAMAANITFNTNSTAHIENSGKKIHLNSTTHNTDLQIDNSTGQFFGHAWSEDLGWIWFGDSNGSAHNLVPDANGVKVNSNGSVTGRALVERSQKLLIFDSSYNGKTYSSNVEVDSTGKFSGHAWSEDLGWVNFKLDATNNASTNGFPLIQPPTAPQNLTVSKDSSISNSSVKLTWQAPANNNGSPITDYVIEYKDSTSSTWLVYDDGVNTNLTTTVAGLEVGKTYNFRIIAKNQAGNSDPSSIVTSQPASLTMSVDSANILINLLPSSDDTKSSIQTVTTSSNYDNGYKLYISSEADTVDSQRLKNGTNYISPVASITNLLNNTWGFRLTNNTAIFGENTDFTTKKFSPLPQLSSKYLLLNTTGASNNNTQVEYGVKVDNTIPSGRYVQTIVYTALVN